MAASRRLPIIQQRTFLPDSLVGGKNAEERYPDEPVLSDAEDPNMNGGYINPPPVKRQFRDPHGDWWDKQERRNFGEPVHEDNDTLGMFSAHEYTWVNSKMAFTQIGTFLAVFFGVCWVVGQLYADKVAFPREFEGGLERELGGSGAVRARAPDDPEPFQSEEAED
ncbi:NADH:ubiquinone oxidoreductase 20.1kD subunit [Xylaria cf. heliscus]|nr:NADH:ubiquinone oxidoreductase 20.1kD subunit [Xylaria cf. heliscus]